MFNATSKFVYNAARATRAVQLLQQDASILGKSCDPTSSIVVRHKSGCDEPPPKKCYHGRPKKRFVPDQDPKYEDCFKQPCEDYVPMDLQERKEYPPCRQKTWDDCPKPPKKVIRTCLTEKEKPPKQKCPAGMCCNEKDGKLKYSTYAAIPRRPFSTQVEARMNIDTRKDLIEIKVDPLKYRRVSMPGVSERATIVKKVKPPKVERRSDKSFRVMAPCPSFSESGRHSLPNRKYIADIPKPPTFVLNTKRTRRSNE